MSYKLTDAAATVMQRCEILGAISEEAGHLVRPYGSRAMAEVNSVVSGWMEAAGMSVRRDGIGNLVGRHDGTGEGTFIFGSHLDTVQDAGKYDGQLGVLVALACVEWFHNRGERLPFAVEIPCFADEEGLRFGTTYLGSSVYAGAFDEKHLRLTDRDGVMLADAVRNFGGNPSTLGRDGRERDGVVGYCEVHIEQGPVLEELDLPVGVVSAITGISRVRAAFSGSAGHAGTVPMDKRQDALCAAAELVLAVEKSATAELGSVGTVGEISASPGAGNVIPGGTTLSLDLRHGEDGIRERLRDRLKARGREIAAARRCEFHWGAQQESPAVPVDPELSALLVRAVEDSGLRAYSLPSGAGHDAAQVARIFPVAMLFVRCKGGVSHNPEESVEREDVSVAIEVMDRFLRLVAQRRSG